MGIADLVAEDESDDGVAHGRQAGLRWPRQSPMATVMTIMVMTIIIPSSPTVARVGIAGPVILTVCIRIELSASSPDCKLRAAPMRVRLLWRIDNNTLANDEVHYLLVDVGPNHFEFERVISGQGLAGLRRQQLGPTLNI